MRAGEEKRGRGGLPWSSASVSRQRPRYEIPDGPKTLYRDPEDDDAIVNSFAKQKGNHDPECGIPVVRASESTLYHLIDSTCIHTQPAGLVLRRNACHSNREADASKTTVWTVHVARCMYPSIKQSAEVCSSW
jgi:hypothetical protein